MRFVAAGSIRIAVVLCTALAMAVALGAQEKKPAEKEEVTISGDHWKWRGGENQSIYTITGSVVVKHLDTTLTADRAEYDEKTRVVTAEGNLKMVDPETEISGAKATAYLNDRKSVIEGDVKLIAKPKPEENPKNPESPRSKFREPATVTCDRMEYLYRKKIATAEGNLKVTQKTRTLVGSKAVYDVNQELLTLTGGVRVTDEEGQTFTSPGTVKASLKEGAEWIEAENGSATLKVNVEEETGGGKTGKTPEKGPGQ